MPGRASLTSLRREVQACRACPLWRDATQAVFGEGRTTARLVLVGEQPGNEEDLAGRPFVGPAGRVLDEALKAAGIARADVYVTNAVKHFRFERRGTRRLHKRPTVGEVRACSPWLDAEIALLHPDVVVCLGATAAQSILGRAFRVTSGHGVPYKTRYAECTLATIHPSAVLRQRTSAERERAMAGLVSDLNIAARNARAKRRSSPSQSARR